MVNYPKYLKEESHKENHQDYSDSVVCHGFAVHNVQFENDGYRFGQHSNAWPIP